MDGELRTHEADDAVERIMADLELLADHLCLGPLSAVALAALGARDEVLASCNRLVDGEAA